MGKMKQIRCFNWLLACGYRCLCLLLAVRIVSQEKRPYQFSLVSSLHCTQSLNNWSGEIWNNGLVKMRELNCWLNLVTHKNVHNPAMLSKSSSGCIIYDQKKMWQWFSSVEQNDATVFQTGKPQTKKWLFVLSVALHRKVSSYHVQWSTTLIYK